MAINIGQVGIERWPYGKRRNPDSDPPRPKEGYSTTLTNDPRPTPPDEFVGDSLQIQLLLSTARGVWPDDTFGCDDLEFLCAGT